MACFNGSDESDNELFFPLLLSASTQYTDAQLRLHGSFANMAFASTNEPSAAVMCHVSHPLFLHLPYLSLMPKVCAM